VRSTQRKAPRYALFTNLLSPVLGKPQPILLHIVLPNGRFLPDDGKGVSTDELEDGLKFYKSNSFLILVILFNFDITEKYFWKTLFHFQSRHVHEADHFLLGIAAYYIQGLTYLLTYLFTPWLYGPLIALTSSIIYVYSPLSTTFCHLLLTFTSLGSFAVSYNHLNLGLPILLLPYG
jgi:hypothetical protein